MIENLKGRIFNFTNAKNYSFDFKRSDLITLSENTKYNISIFDDVNDYETLILFVDSGLKNKTYKLPKKVTLKWIISKINSFEDVKYKNLSSIFNKACTSYTYATSYGFGYSCTYKTKEAFKKDTDFIENKLNTIGIEFKTQMSDGGWVLRYIISSKKENLQKLNSIN